MSQNWMGAFRITNGDIQDRIKHLAHGRQRQCHSPCPWRQQMLVRGATTFPFLIRETRAFNEIYDGSRRITKFLTSVARGLEVSTLLFRMLGEVGLRIAFHERHVHGPPGSAEERKPHQFLLDKELEERNSPVQRRLHGDYVNPGLVIGNYEVPLVLAQIFETANIEVVEFPNEKINELQSTHASPIAISQRLRSARSDRIGNRNFGMASTKIGIKQMIVLIVQAENVSRPRRFRMVFLSKAVNPGSTWPHFSLNLLKLNDRIGKRYTVAGNFRLE